MAGNPLLVYPLLVFLFFALPTLSWGEPAVTWHPEKAVPGQPLLIKVAGENGVSSVSGQINERPIYFFAGPDKTFYALAGIDLEAKGQGLSLDLSGTDEGGRYFRLRREIQLQPREYGVQYLTLPSSLVELDGTTLARVKEETEKFEMAWASFTPERLWQGKFAAPVDGPITGPFGTRRVINGQERSRHSGVDIHAPPGTPVLAPARGRVVLVEDFFFSGKSVVIDHGLGLFSMYFHLSSVEVKPGQQIEKGQALGQVGQSGRTTGPNLHWGVRLNGARIDPFALRDLFQGDEGRGPFPPGTP